MTLLTIDIDKPEIATASDIYRAIGKDHCQLISQSTVKTENSDNDFEPIFTEAAKKEINLYALKVAQLLIIQASSNHGVCSFEMFNNPEDTGLEPQGEEK